MLESILLWAVMGAGLLLLALVLLIPAFAIAMGLFYIFTIFLVFFLATIAVLSHIISSAYHKTKNAVTRKKI